MLFQVAFVGVRGDETSSATCVTGESFTSIRLQPHPIFRASSTSRIFFVSCRDVNGFAMYGSSRAIVRIHLMVETQQRLVIVGEKREHAAVGFEKAVEVSGQVIPADKLVLPMLTRVREPRGRQFQMLVRGVHGPGESTPSFFEL